ncbi:MAG: glycosyltransferase family 2 protein [Patescibacteria group bacterium]
MISVAIIATDLACILPVCLDSAKKLSDDVVIVTNSSHKFVNYSDQKNYAASKCKYNWVLSLDADEELSPELIFELKSLDFKFSAYKIPRLNIIFGKAILHSNWEPSADTHIWLYNKTRGHWENPVHEEVVTTGRVGQLRGTKIHHSYTSIEEFIDKINDYTSREIKAANPFFDFLRRYLWHKGFLDGWHGLFLSYLQAISHVVVWIKLWEKKNLSS